MFLGLTGAGARGLLSTVAMGAFPGVSSRYYAGFHMEGGQEGGAFVLPSKSLPPLPEIASKVTPTQYMLHVPT